MTKKIFLIAGEASGDALGARLMSALKAQTDGDVEFCGVGGPKMHAEGLQTLLPMEDLCVMGIWEVIWQLPRLLRLLAGMVHEIEKSNPDALVTIDLPDFNFNVGKRLKKRGKFKGKHIHYVAPSVWAWRKGRADKISKFLDGIICLLPFEPPYFPKIKSVFAGHSMIENMEPGDGASFRRKFSIPEEARTLGIFYGSRSGELRMHHKLINEVIGMMHEFDPSLQVIVPTLPHLEYEISKITADLSCPVAVVSNPNMKQDAIAACDIALAVSGTICLELAVTGIPHILVYKMHPLTWFILSFIVKTRRAHLGNIILRNNIFPEYVQKKAKPIPVGKALLRLYKVEADRNVQIEQAGTLQVLLGAGMDETPSQRAAAFTLSLISGS